MLRSWFCGMVLVMPAVALAAEPAALFNGKDLKGFVQRNGTATYRVEGDTIVGKTAEGSPNSFLFTEKEYGDFELTFEVKVDDELNSGVQIRSISDPKIKGGRVHGPQVEISTDGFAGYVYGEALDTGWLTADPQKTNVFKNGEWNSYKIRAEGKSIKTWVNGTQVADYTDDKTNMLKGHIGLQVHGIGKGKGPYEVRWRKLMLTDLSK